MIPYAREIGAAVILAAIVGAGWLGWEWRDRSADAEMATIVAQHATAQAEAQSKARAAEQEAVRANARIAAEYEAELDEIRTNARSLAADLAAGNVRLRDHWAGCATDRVSGDATTSRIADESARVRAESAARIIAAADEADAQVRGLQAVVKEDRR